MYWKVLSAELILKCSLGVCISKILGPIDMHCNPSILFLSTPHSIPQWYAIISASFPYNF